MIFALSLIAAAFYSLSSAALSRALKLRREPYAVFANSELAAEVPEAMSQAQRRKLTLICATVAVVIHGWLIINETGLPHSLSLPLTTSLSATTLTIVLIHIALCLRQPADYLGLAVYPLAAVSLLISQASGAVTPTISSPSIQIHVLLSLVSYSVLALAAAQAILVSVQRHYLSAHKPNGIVRSLPPLDTTEQLLFTLLTVGFVLLSLALGSGFIYLEDMFDQRVAHKTALSCIGWAIFGILLFGRWRYGWRGKKAVHWTLAGYAMLILAFFGTKAIIEVVLN